MRNFIHTLAFMVAISLSLVACVEVSEQRAFTRQYSVAEVNTQLSVEIPCRRPWILTGMNEWCHTTTTSGQTATDITLMIEANTSDQERVCELMALSDDVKCTITITQSGAETIVLPVIFHVFYNDKSDSLQYVDASRVATILDKVNAYYAGESGGENINVRFTLATQNPYGATLENPGVEYVKQDVVSMDCMEFMNDNTGKYATYLWDPNSYINIMLYNFDQDSTAESMVLGVSHLPYTQVDTYLPGTNRVSYSYISLENLKYPYSVSINSLYFYHDASIEQWETKDISCTLAHELGHYLGLLHVFSENDDEETCADTDYCADTYSYNYNDYLGYVSYATAHYRGEQLYNALYQRNSCSGEIYFSDNLMDYNWVTAYKFTSDQRTRMRYVLNYSPLLPTARNAVMVRSNATHDTTKLDLPILIAR
ncbi:MAG: zinc-dependent metalloproteinase lipoprotein [Coprobacter sp.]|nr:zinc-dependent metalloproteinase lipoprotein [Coprobacter sp.]